MEGDEGNTLLGRLTVSYRLSDTTLTFPYLL